MFIVCLLAVLSRPYNGVVAQIGVYLMYKDKDKQREAQREWVRQKRAESKGSTQGSTKRGKDIKCFADLPEDVQLTIQRMSSGKEDYKKRVAAAIKYQHLFPDKYENQSTVLLGAVVIGKPGDADYNGVCTPEWRAERGR